MKINTLHNLLSKFLVAYKLKFLVLASTLLFFGFNGYGQNPTVDILGEPAAVNNVSPYSVNVQFSEDVTGFDASDVNVALGSVSNFNPVDGSNYDVEITPDGNQGNITIDIPAGAAQAAIGSLGNTAATQATTLFDDVPPTISIGTPSAAVTSGGPVTYAVTYTGASTINLLAGDITLNNPTGTAAGTVAVTGGTTATPTVTISGITGNGTLSISIAAGTASDGTGNTAPAAGPSGTFTVDNTGPAISIGAPSTTVTSGGPVTYAVTYTGASTINLLAGDITLNNPTGTAAGTVAVTGGTTATPTVTISGITGNGTLSISIAAGTASDGSGNTAPAAGPSGTFTVDNTAPTVSIGAPSSTVTSGGPVTYAVTYTGASTINLLAGDITLNNPTGTAAGTVAVTGGTTATPTVTISGITGNGTLSISIAAGTASDGSGNTAPAAGPSGTFTVDNTGPAISIGAPSTTVTSGGPVTYAVTYTGASTINLLAGDITLNNPTGTAAGTVAVTGGTTATPTVTISGITGNGTLSISIAAGTASDGSGNTAPAAGPSGTFTVDNTAPTVSIGAPSTTVTSGGPVTYAVTYTGASTINLLAGDITLNNPTGTAAGTVAVTGGTTATPTVTISGITGNGTLSISIAAGTASDGAGNTAPATGPSGTFTVDNTGPAISIGAPSTTVTSGGPVTYAVTYTGASTINLLAGDITLNNPTGTAAGTVAVTGGTTATPTVTISGITGNGTLSISIAAGTASDGSGNTAPAAGPSGTFTVDNTGPAISIGAPSTTVTSGGPVTYAVTYTGASTINLLAGDITLNNPTGTAAGTVAVTGGTTATPTVTISGITGNGTLSISIAAGTASDGSGNTAPAAGPSGTFTVDNTAPTVSIGAPSSTVTSGGPVTYAVTYTGASTINLLAGDITLNNPTGTAAGTVAVTGGTTATPTVTISGITGNGTLSISIAAGTASDGAGNTAPAAGPSGTFTVDNTGPAISIGAPSTTVTSGGPVTYAVTYSGANSVSLTAANVTLNNTGTAAGTIAVGGTGSTTRTVTINAISGDGTLGISVAANTASDAGGNTAPAAGPSGTFTVDNTAPTGYSVNINQDPITTGNQTTVSFTFSGATVGTIYNYSFSSSEGVANVTGTGTVSGAGQTISGINLSSLADGNITLSVTLTDNVGNIGNTATDTSTKITAGVAIDDVLVNEDDGTATFTVTLNGTVLLGTFVSYETANNTAMAASDYVADSGTLFFSGLSGQTRTITIDINDDTEAENTETFYVNLTNATGFALISKSQGVGTIADNDNCIEAPLINSTPTIFCDAFTQDLDAYTDTDIPAGFELIWSSNSDFSIEGARLNTSVVDFEATFYGFLFNEGTGCLSPPLEVTLVRNIPPEILDTTPSTICGQGTATISATVTDGGSIFWYSEESVGLPLGEGSNFETPSVNVTTTFWVEASANECITERTPVIVTVSEQVSVGTITDTSACSIPGGGPTTVDLDDTRAGGTAGVWTIVGTPPSTVAIGADNIVDFEGVADGDYVFRFTTNTAVSPCVDESVDVTITVTTCTMDSDGDGLFDRDETALGLDPTLRDTDADGIEDGVEVGPDINNPIDTDSDGIIDALDSNILDSDNDGVVDQLDPANTNPCIPNISTACRIDLALEKTVDRESILVGREVIFTVTLTNLSQIMVTNIAVNDLVSPATGFRYVIHSASKGDYDAVAGVWQLDEMLAEEVVTLTITAEVPEIGTYQNIAAIVDSFPEDGNATNNTASASVTVTPRSSSECGFLFNQISPNGDGFNDSVYINCIGDYPNNTLEVYDRYGNEVFAASGYDNTWMGTGKNGDLPKGTYFYILDLGDGTEVRKGWIQIIR